MSFTGKTPKDFIQILTLTYISEQAIVRIDSILKLHSFIQYTEHELCYMGHGLYNITYISTHGYMY